MLYYVNIALSVFLVGLVVFVLSQLKAERRITQKHFDGDWRQKIFKKFSEHFFDKILDHILSLQLILLLLFRFLYLIYDKNDQYLFNTNLFLQNLLGPDLIIRDSSGAITNGLFEISLFIAFNLVLLGMASFVINAINYIFFYNIIPFFINIIYYNPQNKYCLVKSKSSGKYTIFSSNDYYRPAPHYTYLPNPDYILQHLGKYNNSEFDSKQDVLNAISKLKNKDNIISNLIDKN